MKKNFKKYLSYVLGVVLALGVGFSYAYAVGANDSNAFVTLSEWQAKIAQLEASLDNVTKTINDNNMDYVMNGPRLQTNMIEGFENATGSVNGAIALQTNADYMYYTASDIRNKYNRYNRLELVDTWDGRQGLHTWSIPTSNQSADVVRCKMRFAVKVDNEQDLYLVISQYRATTTGWRGMIATYVRVNASQQDYATAKTLSVTLPLTEWWILSGDISNGNFNDANTTTAVYTGTPNDGLMWPETIVSTYDNTGGSIMSNPGQGRIERVVDKTAMTVKMTFTFPATACSIKQNYSNAIAWQYQPLDMSKRKFGNAYDTLCISGGNGSTPRGAIVKVYSPQKGCLALKSYLNGEVPILNE
jgi:hypothetical protein